MTQSIDYVVQPGDTLSEIAHAQGYRGEALWQAVADWTRANDNIKNNGDLIFAGDTIQISRNGNTAAPTAETIDETRLAGPGSFENFQSETNTATGNWMDIARNEIGQNEIAGSRDNPRIVEYHGTTSLNASDDETPWCASFVNWVMEQAGMAGTDSAAAISWADWGQASELKPGAVVVIQNRQTGQHHVGFFAEGGPGNLTLLGGNQSNTVKYSTFGSSYEILATRMPN